MLQRPSSPWASLNRVSRRPRNKLELLHAPNFCLPSCTCTACRVGASTERSRSRRQAGQAGLCRALVRSDPPPFGRERTHGARLRNSSRWFSWAVRRLTFSACTACRVGASTEQSCSRRQAGQAGLCRALVRSDPPPFGRERTHGARLRNSSRWFSWAVRRLTFGACTACRVGASTERSRSSSYRVRAGSKGREKETEKRLDHRTSAFEKTICHNQRYAYRRIATESKSEKMDLFSWSRHRPKGCDS